MLQHSQCLRKEGAKPDMGEGRYLEVGAIAAVAYLVMGSTIYAQEFNIQPIANAQFQQNDPSILGDGRIGDDQLLGKLGFTSRYGKFSVDFFGTLNIASAAFSTHDNNIDWHPNIDRSALKLTGRYELAPFAQIIGGIKRVKVEHADLYTPSSQISSGGAFFHNPASEVRDRITRSIGPFAGVSFGGPVTDVDTLSLTGTMSYLKSNETSETAFFFEDGLFDSGSLESVRSERDLEVLKFDLQLDWRGEPRPMSFFFSHLSYGLDLDYSASSYDDEGKRALDHAILGRVDATFHFAH